MSRADLSASRRKELVATLGDINTELGPLDREDLLLLLVGADNAVLALVMEAAEVLARAEAFIAPMEDEPVHEDGLQQVLADLRRVIPKAREVGS